MPILVTPWSIDHESKIHEKATGWDVVEGRLLLTDDNDEGVATYAAGAWVSASDITQDQADALLGRGKVATEKQSDPKKVMAPTGPIVHAVMYRDHRMGTLCDSGAWGTPDLFTAVTEHVTCPGCRNKIDPGRS